MSGSDAAAGRRRAAAAGAGRRRWAAAGRRCRRAAPHPQSRYSAPPVTGGAAPIVGACCCGTATDAAGAAAATLLPQRSDPRLPVSRRAPSGRKLVGALILEHARRRAQRPAPVSRNEISTVRQRRTATFVDECVGAPRVDRHQPTAGRHGDLPRADHRGIDLALVTAARGCERRQRGQRARARCVVGDAAGGACSCGSLVESQSRAAHR